MRRLKQESGMALIVSLIILTIITLGSVVAMQRANTQSKMIGNLQHKQALFTTGQNEINFMLEQLKEDDIRQSMLGLFDSNSSGKNDQLLFISDELKGHFTIKNEIRKVSLPTVNNSLKSIEGSSAGTPALRPYYLASTVTVKEKYYNHLTDTGIKDVQEIGFYYLIPTAVDAH